MTSTAAAVQAGSFLTLHYRLAGPVGDVVNTFAGKPATLTLGTGELSPALEQQLLGLVEGQCAVFELAAGVAFGQRSPDMPQWLSRKELADLGDPAEQYAVGDVLHFPTPDGQGQFAGSVQGLRDDEAGQAVLFDFNLAGQAVLFDFNHPLAGQPVTFEVLVIGIL